MSLEQHRRKSNIPVMCHVITVSDTRTKDTDRSGQLIHQLIADHGHQVADYHIIKDEYTEIQSLLRESATQPEIDVILLNGGTGIAKRDTTVEAVSSLLDKELPGFGELFRYLSFTEDIGSAAILSRAIAGVHNNTAIFSMPGSTGAVNLAMTRLILPELHHIVREIRKDL